MRFFARLGVVLNDRARLMLRIGGLNVRYCVARLRYDEDTAFMLDSGSLCAEYDESEDLSALSREMKIRVSPGFHALGNHLTLVLVRGVEGKGTFKGKSTSRPQVKECW